VVCWVSFVFSRIRTEACRRFFIAARTPCRAPQFSARSLSLPPSAGWDTKSGLSITSLMRGCESRSLCLQPPASRCRTWHRLPLLPYLGGDFELRRIPPTKTCMNCHSQIWTNAQLLEPVRASYRSGSLLQWTRVNQLPDFVFFKITAFTRNQGRGLQHLPRTGGPDAADVPAGIAADGVVPGLPSRRRRITCARAIRFSTCVTSSPRAPIQSSWMDRVIPIKSTWYSVGEEVQRPQRGDITSCNTCHDDSSPVGRHKIARHGSAGLEAIKLTQVPGRYWITNE